MVQFHIISIFPEAIEPYTSASLIGRAQKDGKIGVHYYNPREYTKDRLRRIDSKPYGGGPGMVLEPQSFLAAADKAIGRKKDVTVLFFSPSGRQFDQEMARELSEKKHIVMLSGRYEGLDARVPQILNAIPVSIGPYVLTGGELPSAVVVDAVVRHVPGVLGNQNSIEESRTSTHQAENERICASAEVYTRPETLIWKRKKYTVPEVLLSGNHKEIEAWKHKKEREREM